ncbi:Kynurenine formamidase [Entophlyctis sp. JEL0112]|nr:Kynurenine formamidase [Entophlyctis sp. JEL0112]
MVLTSSLTAARRRVPGISYLPPSHALPSISDGLRNEESPAFNVLDLYVPSDGPPPTADVPLLIFVHGGAWRSNSPAQFVGVAEGFLSQGFGVAVVGYRLSVQQPTGGGAARVSHPNHVEDVAAGVAWILAQCAGEAAKDGSISNNSVAANLIRAWNPTRVFLAGHSAGAQICSLLSLRPHYIQTALLRLGANLQVPWERIRGYIGIEGIYDIPLLVKTYPAYRDWFIVAAFGNDGDDRWIDGSPTHAATNELDARASHLIIFSENDELVDLAQSESWFQCLNSEKKRRIDAAVKNATEWDIKMDSSLHSKHDEVLLDPEFFKIVGEWINQKG